MSLKCNKCGGIFPESLFTVCHSKEPGSQTPIGVCDNCMGLSVVEDPEPETEPETSEDPVEEPTEE